MKTPFVLGFALMTVFSTFAQEKDPVKKANATNEKKAGNNEIASQETADFLVKSADARLMDTKEGRLATERGTTAAIREYGKLMLKDQAALMQQIKELAAKRNIALPGGISSDKEDGRETLAGKTGKEFDEKFVKMMKVDHQRDVKLFKEAAKSKDKGISEFAQKYLPMIQSHLNKIEAME